MRDLAMENASRLLIKRIFMIKAREETAENLKRINTKGLLSTKKRKIYSLVGKGITKQF